MHDDDDDMSRMEMQFYCINFSKFILNSYSYPGELNVTVNSVPRMNLTRIRSLLVYTW